MLNVNIVCNSQLKDSSCVCTFMNSVAGVMNSTIYIFFSETDR